MAKVYVDTNRLLDFYRYPDAELDQLQQHKSKLVLTEQTIIEFRRNRVSLLQELKVSFKADRPPAANIFQNFEPHKEIEAVYAKNSAEILKHLDTLIEEETKDAFAQAILGLYRDPAVLSLKLSEKAVERAHRRKLLGNPPSSDKKHTVGDEVIWELVLSGMKDDLILVSRDKTFSNNFVILRDEYAESTGRKLLLAPPN